MEAITQILKEWKNIVWNDMYLFLVLHSSLRALKRAAISLILFPGGPNRGVFLSLNQPINERAN
jgi:hypothetical protein